MKTALHLARPEDLDRLETLVTACHAETGVAADPENRRAALAPLLDGSPHGVAYLAGPARAPVGYVIVSFGWSVEHGGLHGVIADLYVRPPVRGRGIATEILLTLPPALADAGLRELHLSLHQANDQARRLFARAGFAERDGYIELTRQLF
ncbi:MAG: GNAT family N-acetyltransferase [Rhodobacteraceae bacterium]|nr:GNAT family N-acetyltransferase [Paracoccaceae bacterium]